MSAKQAFTLMEVMFCLLIVMIASLAAVSGIIYTRLNMELEKQRLAALNYCRQGIEAVNSLDDAYSGSFSLVPFNSPGIDDLNANVDIEYYRMNANGTVAWDSPTSSPRLDEPIFSRVTVSWIPYGSMNRPQEVSMSTIVTKGIN